MFMFLPLELKATRTDTRVPLANAVLVAINVIAFCLGLSTAWSVGPGSGLFSILTYGFAHAGIWHLAANMWVLLVFGNPVNRRLGNAWYLVAYLGTLVALGLFARLCVGGYLVGASGAIFAVIMIAMILMPAARIEIGYFALFPITLLIALIHRPEEWIYLLIRWGRFSVRAVWGLLLVPLLELWSLCWSGWNWTDSGHLFGMLCGLAVVLLLPARITMPRRAAAGAF
ncbi:MAG TPA: rhomboid family intramembrane serine protease [Pirellulales bacterium]|nr:rhomboid family intramembrane serine protease [Pirellulales bacterium]